MKVKRRLASPAQAVGEFSFRHQRQQPLRGPQGNGRGSCARTLQADLAQVKILRGEVRVGRIVPVEPAYPGSHKQDAAAAVGLQPVLVGIDNIESAWATQAKARAASAARFEARTK